MNFQNKKIPCILQICVKSESNLKFQLRGLGISARKRGGVPGVLRIQPEPLEDGDIRVVHTTLLTSSWQGIVGGFVSLLRISTSALWKCPYSCSHREGYRFRELKLSKNPNERTCQ